jgi:hypothetical protein
VSIFPDKAARLVGNDVANEAASKLPQVFKQAWQEFSGKYPRIAAHAKPYVINPVSAFMTGLEKGTEGVTDIPSGHVTSPVPIGITSTGLTERTSPTDALGLLTHEGTHVAQALGNSDLKTLYRAANKLTGYAQNPFEQAAFNNEGYIIRPPFNAINDLWRAVADRTKWQYGDALPIKSAETAATIKTILQERAAKGWKPTP